MLAHESSKKPVTFNVNSGISIGLALLIVGATWTLKDSNNALGTRLSALELKQSLTKEPPKESWSETDMIRWAVHLQQANKAIPNFRVPEPQHGAASDN
jgi:hypothetical protein